jgi:hypothetical protein
MGSKKSGRSPPLSHLTVVGAMFELSNTTAISAANHEWAGRSHASRGFCAATAHVIGVPRNCLAIPTPSLVFIFDLL